MSRIPRKMQGGTMSQPEASNDTAQQQINRIGSPQQAYDEILELLPNESLKVLDVPAGHGAFTQMLQARGFQVTAGDVVPEAFHVAGMECVDCNLNERLPFEDGEYDVAMACNAVHRVYAVGSAIAEYARVLKPGGRLFITTPNYTRLNRRVAFFFTGVISKAVVKSGAISENPEAHFRQPLSVAQILTATEAAGLELKGLTGFRWKCHRLIYLPFWFLIRLGLLFVSSKRKAQYFLNETHTFSALFSDFLLLELKKPD